MSFGLCLSVFMSVFECVYVCVCGHTNAPLESCGWERYVCNAIQYIDPLADNRRKVVFMSISRVYPVSCLLSLMPHVSYLSRVACVYIHPLADNRRKGRCIRRHDTSATTPSATVGATSVGRAHMTTMNSLPDTPPPINTHAHTHCT